jgi:hypothetical protein
MKMEKYCLSREHNNSKWYFTGKLIRRHDGKYDYWEGTNLTPNMATNTWDNYFDALNMKLECLFVKGRLYEILLSEDEHNKNK